MYTRYLNKTTKAAPLAVFRIFFGLMMLLSIIRFWSKGWIEQLYIQPKFYFTYYGFELVKPLGEWTYVLFVICGLSALGVCLGWKYRISSIIFFLSFTYIELIDKTTYLNHYYFVSILSFLMLFLPAHVYYSIDAISNKKLQVTYISKWNIDSIKLLLAIVYIYAGLAKINSDWLIEAQPLGMWLRVKTAVPLLGNMFQYKWVHYFFSWFGMLYDVFIVFFLLNRKTRPVAYFFVIAFHILTRILFPIGMFPYVMIISTLVFFDASLHEKIILALQKGISVLSRGKVVWDSNKSDGIYFQKTNKIVLIVIAVFFTIQLLLPWRYLMYPEELFWTEEGYRFSWRVMLIEKVGIATFSIVDPSTGKRFEIRNNDFLTSTQIKQMSTQPDFILQYAHMLKDHYIREGIAQPEVYVESYVTLNGRLSQAFIDPTINLVGEKESFAHKKWILPFHGTIKGI